jgi:GT2 family glycosyltransferase
MTRLENSNSHRSLPTDSELVQVGAVIIGRNEGQRLITCLESILYETPRVVYVDSGSTDGSAEAAEVRGVEVVRLDMSRPFTAARARNAGMARLVQTYPVVAFVQFIDGDCELVANWMTTAVTFLQECPSVAAVCGRLQERFPQQSVYNRLCDAEWDRPAGQVAACGGIFMARRAAFESVHGFREDIVAGEEPELCSRWRVHGLMICRLNESMALHDAAITRFRQWWVRSRRGGYASALLGDVPGYLDALQRQRHNRGIVTWSVVIPLVVVVGALALHPAFLAGLLAYPAQIGRLALRSEQRGRQRWEVATFTVLGKFPALLGLADYMRSRRDRRHRAFDYKS